MTKDDKTQLLHALTCTALAYNANFLTARQEVYVDELKDLPLQTIIQALICCRRTLTFFPSIAEIRQVCHGGGSEQLAEEAWASLRRLTGSTAYNPQALHDPVIAECFRRLGGREMFGVWDYEHDESWKRKRFIEEYQNIRAFSTRYTRVPIAQAEETLRTIAQGAP